MKGVFYLKKEQFNDIKEIMEISPNGDSNTIYLNDGKNKKYYSLKPLREKMIE